ncbi:trihelix transcription factor DF1-like [Lycium ferocissimum]|uniref:trihelix transcription factor DF1-like n=1 Tax=Lycium ferocissimum TaxID=112874 RepID=UPI002815CA90|nr:trihelix transcription factor DF1-like [Lycium ferocissimum]
MQSNYEMAGIHHQRNQPPAQVEEQKQQQRFLMENASTSSPFYPINSSYHFPHQQPHPLLQQIHHIPFTQQFFQYQQHPHYRSMLDHQQHQEIRLDPSAEVENNDFFPLSFKLGMEGDSVSKASSGYGEEGEIRQEDALIRGSEGYCTQPRQTSLAVSHCWQNQEDSAIKQPFWKPLNTEFSNGNNNSNESEKNKQEEDQEMYPPEEIQHHQQIIKNLEENKCRVLFGELEAIYATNADNTNATTNIHRIASESVLTAEDLPTNHNVCIPVVFNDSNQASGATTAMATTIAGSESASVGEREAELEVEATRGEVNKRKRRKKAKEGTTSTSMTRFFESLVKKLADHQEDLQRKFMEAIERLDEERKEREETWREQEWARLEKEAAARAHERTLASSREAVLVSYLEKLTGQKINFDQPIKNEDKSCLSLAKLNNKRWPQVEVDALVQIRTNLESKFQEAGPKGLLWEEISYSMASMGFQRSARRCKEKWENMHKCTVKRTTEITREQFHDGNSSTATADFVNQGNDTVDHLATVNLPEGNGEKDKHGNGEYKNGSGKEAVEELKEE